MLTFKKKNQFTILCRMMVLPLLAAVVLLFAFRLQNENAAIATGSLFKLVVDAGHGGTDEGAIGKNNLKEKDITLAL